MEGMNPPQHPQEERKGLETNKEKKNLEEEVVDRPAGSISHPPSAIVPFPIHPAMHSQSNPGSSPVAIHPSIHRTGEGQAHGQRI